MAEAISKISKVDPLCDDDWQVRTTYAHIGRPIFKPSRFEFKAIVFAVVANLVRSASAGHPTMNEGYYYVSRNLYADHYGIR